MSPRLEISLEEPSLKQRKLEDAELPQRLIEACVFCSYKRTTNKRGGGRDEKRGNEGERRERREERGKKRKSGINEDSPSERATIRITNKF